jgi:hypothetical protein
MAASYNKQPVFTSTPLLVCSTFDPEINTNSSDPTIWSSGPAYTFDQPTLVERVTITSCGDLTYNIVTAKLIYIFFYWGNNGTYSLYKTLAMPATTLDATTPNPELEITMNGGVLFNDGDGILLGASTNYQDTGEGGDFISITLEGGTYAAV